jgi:uncharacterized DUF497 family protein
MIFEWDENKNNSNIEKHGISFEYAQQAFLDTKRIIAEDVKHSIESEKRYFCFGKVEDVVITVRFTIRQNVIRIFGAGAWREGRKIYEQENN